jgi:hypothetical protein
MKERGRKEAKGYNVRLKYLQTRGGGGEGKEEENGWRLKE